MPQLSDDHEISGSEFRWDYWKSFFIPKFFRLTIKVNDLFHIPLIYDSGLILKNLSWILLTFFSGILGSKPELKWFKTSQLLKIRNFIRIICNNGFKENNKRSVQDLLKFYSIYEKLKYMYMPHFRAFGMINLQYETMKPQMTKTSQDNNLNYIHFLKHFYEYHTEKVKYRDVTCLILKVLPW